MNTHQLLLTTATITGTTVFQLLGAEASISNFDHLYLEASTTDLLDISDRESSKSSLMNSALTPENYLAQSGIPILREGDSGNQAGIVSEIASTYSYSYNQTITAVRTAEGTLRLIGWQIDDDGSVTRTGDSGNQAGQASQIDIAAGRTIVTAVRTPSDNLKLISWTVGNTGNINRFGDSGDQAGFASLVRITQVYADIFVTAVRTAEGNLKLISWRQNSDGSLTRLNDSDNSVGAVSEIALSLESINNTRHVITSVRDSQGNLKLIDWEVSPDGEITRRGDSGNQAGDARMIRAQNVGDYTVTSVQTSSGILRLISWSISPAPGGGVSIVRVDDSGNQAGSIQDNALLRRPAGAVSAVRTASGDLKLIRWQVTNSGAFVRVGDSADQAGNATLISVSPNPNSSQVPIVTAVRTAQNRLRLIIWND